MWYNSSRSSGPTNEFASLPGEFATVDKLSFRHNLLMTNKLRPRKN
jgi:hypothetical protein